MFWLRRWGRPSESNVTADSFTLAMQSQIGLPTNYYQYLVSGGASLTSKTPDTRIYEPQLITAGTLSIYERIDVYLQLLPRQSGSSFLSNVAADGLQPHANYENLSGCDSALFRWVEVTVGAGTNGTAQTANFSTNHSPNAVTTGEGSTAMGFYKMQNGDVPYFKSLVDNTR